MVAIITTRLLLWKENYDKACSYIRGINRNFFNSSRDIFRTMKHIVHIHQQRLRKGLPAIIHRTYKGVEYHDTFEVPKNAKVVQSLDKPLSCGARCWVEWNDKDE
jgi:hypothetical protein